jgi:hypothetical protein
MVAALILAATGFVNMPKAIAQHPLYPAIVQYDREIAALRATQRVPGLTSIGATVRSDAATMQANAADAARYARSTGSANGAAYRAREQNLLAGMQSQSIPEHDAAAYRAQANRSATAMLAAYRSAMAQRMHRALAARRQQLREKESTLAFDLEKQNAGKRLLLVVKLRNMHLDAEERGRSQAQLAALDAKVDGAVAAAQRADDAQLAAYSAQLAARENSDDARMAATVARSNSSTVADRSRLSETMPRAAADLHGFDPSADASSVAANLERAGRDLGRRFAQLASVATTSDKDTAARIAALELTRRTVYDAIVRQIRDGAQRAARERHIAGVAFGTQAPKGAVDLTSAIPLPI